MEGVFLVVFLVVLGKLVVFVFWGLGIIYGYFVPKCIKSWFCLQRELVLYPDKNGRVSDLLEEARKQVELVDKEAGKLRLVPCLVCTK